ncbi:MAG: hypothetical protein Unbinned465contig1000_3 [Prokaryotic dsDNA virus sp.]|nr:MAG: hypothetical protein Unbinned465contig1000_3 [Prokaryotic dsDNA virus sp.]|tara:strand:+ start:13763 stop:14230 length:468 start_codon:yes stop_codon:yes gene_type:complete
MTKPKFTGDQPSVELAKRFGHKRVRVYRNLNNGMLSVKDHYFDSPTYGKVIAYSNKVLIRGADFKVSKAGHNRVLREGRKHVHAYVEGILSDIVPHELHGESTYVSYRTERRWGPHFREVSLTTPESPFGKIAKSAMWAYLTTGAQTAMDVTWQH